MCTVSKYKNFYNIKFWDIELDLQGCHYRKSMKGDIMISCTNAFLASVTALNLVPQSVEMINSKGTKVIEFNHELAFYPCTFGSLLPH